MKRILFPALVVVLLTGCESNVSNSARPDNTSINSRDADSKTVTPLDQSNKPADIDQVASIRKAVLDIENLSVNGRNVKIVTGDGKVILRGPVDSAAERDAIQKATEKIAGAGNVTNEIEIKSN